MWFIVTTWPRIAFSQKPQPLIKGTSVPALMIKGSIGDSDFIRPLYHYKGKLILIDFWGSFCGTCWAALPDLVALQNQFQDKLQIFIVTTESRKQIEKTVARIHHSAADQPLLKAARQLTFITDDTVFSKLFPYRLLPTHVWINPDMTYRTTTYPTSTHAETVQALLAGNSPSLDELIVEDLDIDHPLTWIDNAPGNSSMSRYLFVTPYREIGQKAVMFSQWLMDSVSGKMKGLSAVNLSLLALYKKAYSYWEPDSSLIEIPDNRISVPPTLENRFFYDGISPPTYAEWFVQNTYCFASFGPALDSSMFYRELATMIDLTFGLHSAIERKKVKCWVLRKVSYKTKYHSTNSDSNVEEKNGKIILHHVSNGQLYTQVRRILLQREKRILFFNQIKDEEPIDIILPWSRKDPLVSLNLVKETLLKHGFVLIQEMISVPMLTIREADKKR